MSQPLKAIARQHTQDRTQLRLQEETFKLSRALGDNPILQGRVVEVTNMSSATLVEHKLGRTPIGCIVIEQTTPTTALEQTSKDSEHLQFTPIGGNFSGKFWVF